MTRRRSAPTPDAWEVRLDEFHPNPGVAAKYADQQARLSTRRILLDTKANLEQRVKKLVGSSAVLTHDENTELKSARYHLKLTNEALAEVEQRIADFNEKEDD